MLEANRTLKNILERTGREIALCVVGKHYVRIIIIIIIIIIINESMEIT
jgi:hypothetical protein